MKQAERAGTSACRDWRWAAVCAVLFSALHVFHYLRFNAYPFFAVESLSLTALAAGVFLLVFAGVRALRAGWLFYAGLLFLFFDLHFGFANRPFWEYLPKPFRSLGSPLWLHSTSGLFGEVYLLKKISREIPHMPLWNYLLAAAGFCFISFRLRKKFPPVLAGMLGVMFLGSIVQFGLTPVPLIKIQTRADDVPRRVQPEGDVFVFVLDEHAGLEAIPDLDRRGQKLKERLARHYTDRGFTLYAGAYSNYFDTHNSIPSLFTQQIYPVNNYGYGLEKNVLLESLLDRGYALQIYQNDKKDFCGPLSGRFHQCLEYRANSAGYIQNLPLSRNEKFWFLLDSFSAAHQSELLIIVNRKIAAWMDRQRRSRTGPAGVMPVLDALRKDIRTAPQGTAFILHLMMPHYPYLYDEHCRLKRLKHWEDRDRHGDGNSLQEWHDRQEHYQGQIACLDQKLEEVFQTMEDADRFQNAAIMIFSDHGSRITLASPVSEQEQAFLKEDWLAAFSAFAAFKKGAAFSERKFPAPGIVEERLPLALILRERFGLPALSWEEAVFFYPVYLRKNWESKEMEAYSYLKEES